MYRWYPVSLSSLSVLHSRKLLRRHRLPHRHRYRQHSSLSRIQMRDLYVKIVIRTIEVRRTVDRITEAVTIVRVDLRREIVLRTARVAQEEV